MHTRTYDLFEYLDMFRRLSAGTGIRFETWVYWSISRYAFIEPVALFQIDPTSYNQSFRLAELSQFLVDNLYPSLVDNYRNTLDQRPAMAFQGSRLIIRYGDHDVRVQQQLATGTTQNYVQSQPYAGHVGNFETKRVY